MGEKEEVKRRGGVSKGEEVRRLRQSDATTPTTQVSSASRRIRPPQPSIQVAQGRGERKGKGGEGVKVIEEYLQRKEKSQEKE